ncbi:hypothetical protein [Cellulomonas composti]|uniref:Uncharacterized protein n=1 Tax=Cellulomonas composti TaxID=266130 RepID=A0A511J821_9CELL|nr:hypothetical protein [Cellulomonas composti]GEL94150.1 hypothetical protein CCO02nite_08080 [Cellulomonas composti]
MTESPESPRLQYVQPLDLAYAPPSYPQPELDASCTAARAYLPADVEVGWIVRQGDTAFAWCPTATPAEPVALELGRYITEVVRDIALDGAPVPVAWNVVSERLLTEPAREMTYAEVLALAYPDSRE